ncbi:hypothetical protein ORG27_15485 [Stenotrophomonas lactitubi]|uniref:hypothetical protein n=1 Tax=Stenotrophomonas lactitubi TaxID=2045214 RepID=UPI0022487CBD|nr:hypothetical protein [Stenotrophomonas lactitubi]MCX2894982.1 hypothetical protein [Stenotrophomonas lactitubi]
MKKLLTIAILAAAAFAVPMVLAQNAGQPAPQQGDQADKAQSEADAKAKRRAQANAEMKAKGQPVPQQEEEEEARKKK